jgi:SAM-dependent methyltransferase
VSPYPGEGLEPAAPEVDLDAATREHYENAVLYDHEYRRRRVDVSFYRSLARHLGADDVLDLACGSGRVTLPLARDGRRVVGIDLSMPMLIRANQRAQKLGRAARARLALLRGDMRRFALARRFPLVISAFNAFEHLYTRTDLAACLASVREHLAPGGRLAFDVQNPDLKWLSRDPRKRWARTRFRDPTTGTRVEYTTNHIYDPVSQIAYIKFYYQTLEDDPAERHLSVVRLAQRKFFPAELEALVSASGFQIEYRYGEFDGEALTSDQESQILICTAR